MFNQVVRATSELERILALPRRKQDEVDPELVRRLTALLKTPDGTQSLRAKQALAISDAWHCRGGFFPLGVGEGKTLITFMIPYVLRAKRPALFMPASLQSKTAKDWKEYRKNWLVPNNIQYVTYEWLGRVNAAPFLEEQRFDCLLLDEGHRAKNKKAACTRRLMRYVQDHPEVPVFILSGTMMRKSLLDFGHLIQWTHGKDKAPVPATVNELQEWAAALDEKVNEWERYEPGALVRLNNNDIDQDTLTRARRGFQKRLVETPGVVATIGKDGERVDASIYVRAVKYDPGVSEEDWFRLRKNMRTPDDWELTQAVDVWRHAKELALGLYYAWDPRPPPEWRKARKDWAAFVRDVLSRSRTLDSELQVVQACDAGKLPNDTLIAWRAIKDTFKPNVVPRWLNDNAINECIKWAKEPGIVWTEHDLFARRLAEKSGLKYYRAKGCTDSGEHVYDADTSKAVILSIDANKEGLNLQKMFRRMLYASLPEGADVLQQSIGRLHRPGFDWDEVEIDILLGCKEHYQAWKRAYAAAEAIKDTTGADSKLLLADVDWPSDEEFLAFTGSRWGLDKADKES